MPETPASTADPGLPTRRLSWRVRSALSLVAGALLALGFEPYGLWPATPIGIALLCWLAMTAPRARHAAWCGFVSGLVLNLMTVSFQAAVAWWIVVLMVPALALWTMLVAAGQYVVRRLPLWPVWAACLWTLAEAGAMRIPFGGFAWTRLAFTLPDQPLGGYLSVVGAVGAGWLLAFTGCLLTACVIAMSGGQLHWRRVLAVSLSLVIAGALGGAVLAARPMPPANDNSEAGELTIGLVQGNVDGSEGSHTMGYARSVTNNHLSETIMTMARARAGIDPTPDFLAWPENSTDMDPNTDARTRQIIEHAQAIAGRPILVGAVTQGPGADERQTTALWWTENGETDRYAKRRAVPFGEFTPLKDLVFAVAPMARQVGRQTVPGTEPGVIDGALNTGDSVQVGDVICYELAFDSVVRDTVTNGARVMVVQSNNASYSGTMQPAQQFAITRVRAMEMRREVVVSTTSSLSGLIDGRGQVIEQSSESTAWTTSVTVPLRTNISAGVRVAPIFELIACLVAVAAMAIGTVMSHRARRSSSLH